MDWLRNGAEFTRQKVLQLIWQSWQWVDARRLQKAETHLGELGWQQADFPPAVQETINTINRIENEQGHLYNESSDVAAEISAQQREREARRAEYDTARRALVAEITPQQAEIARIEATRDGQRALTASLREHLPELERAQRQHRNGLEQLGSGATETLMPEQLADERVRLTDLLNATISSLSAAHEGMEQAVQKIRTHDAEIAEITPGLEAAQHQLEALDAGFNAADHPRAEALRVLQQRKSELERQLAALDHDKTGYFLIVGRCLADAEIPPMNQPDALQRVLELRRAVLHRTGAITSSRAWCAAVPPGQVRKFYLALAIVAVVLFIALRLLRS